MAQGAEEDRDGSGLGLAPVRREEGRGHPGGEEGRRQVHQVAERLRGKPLTGSSLGEKRMEPRGGRRVGRHLDFDPVPPGKPNIVPAL